MDKELLRKFMRGECTHEEFQTVISWFNEHGEEKFLDLIEADWHRWEDHTSDNNERIPRILTKIHTKITEKELDLVHKEKQISPMPIAYKRHNYSKYSVAAVISLLLVAAAIFVLRFSVEPADQSVVALKRKEVPTGQKATIYLDDGTKVKLNAGSNIEFPEKFSENAREVLLEGEAFFEVVEDQKRPFTVISGDVTTTALGTSFNVKAYDNEGNVEVALATGKVKIKDNRHNSVPIILIPGEILNLDTNNGKSSKANFISKEKLGWTESLLYFKDAGAQQVFTTLERWYGVKFTFNKEVREGWKYSGEFKNKSLEIVLEGISYVKEFEFSFRDGKQVEIYFK
ncbi:FecR domain-containing protein [Fulvivirgaceae bacterium BMA12]|uniref:FecR domain-containing protein n=1 Tax=Agaribacillus aureus TaxID=3051825 RepID=A0ABT8L701_9BACT|nr:FecR domain-containing protein [Fulvivirgaceae bacterium BMA12]